MAKSVPKETSTGIDPSSQIVLDELNESLKTPEHEIISRTKLFDLPSSGTIPYLDTDTMKYTDTLSVSMKGSSFLRMNIIINVLFVLLFCFLVIMLRKSQTIVKVKVMAMYAMAVMLVFIYDKNAPYARGR
jgi:hypothetical protein